MNDVQDSTQICTRLVFVCTDIDVKLQIEHRALFLVAQLHCLNNMDGLTVASGQPACSYIMSRHHKARQVQSIANSNEPHPKQNLLHTLLPSGA